MNEFLEAVAQTMRNLGVEARVYDDWLVCGGMEFQCQRTRGRGFRFVGRTYRTGNVTQAAVDLVGRLAAFRRQVEAKQEHARRVAAANALTEKLDCGMIVVYDSGKFRLHYECDSIEEIERMALRLSQELAAEWDALLTQKLETTARFTSEGGFSLN